MPSPRIHPAALAAAGLALALGAAPAAAQDFGGPTLNPLVGLGLTIGGDKIISDIEYDDGVSEDVQAGQLIHLYAGARYQGVANLSVQATLGYHVDQTRYASNGSAKFVRWPLEILAHYHLDHHLHIGGGVRLVNGVRASASGFLADVPGANVRFKSAVGLVVEAEYLVASQVGVKLRAVQEEFEAKAPFSGTLDGSHVGLMLTWYL